MPLLRYLALLSLALWVGGLVALGLGAPVIFDVLETVDPVAGRTLAGLVFGHVLERFMLVGAGFGVIVLAALALRAALGPRPRRFAARTWVAAGMLAACLTVGLYIGPQIDTIRNRVHGSVADLPDHDARRQRFARLHGMSNGLVAATVVAGLALLWMEMRDDH